MTPTADIKPQHTTDTRFVFNPADDDGVDAEYVLITNPNWTVQVAPYAGGHVVNEHGGEGSDFWLRDHGVFRNRQRAFDHCAALAAKTAA